jgi:hypothetical protein
MIQAKLPLIEQRITYRVMTILIGVTCLISVFWLVHNVILPSTKQMTHGFISGYIASRLLVSGAFGPLVYDDAWFMRQVQSQTGLPIQEIYSPNLPTFALLTLPFVSLPPLAARAAWLWTNMVFLVFALWLIGRVFRKASTPPGIITVLCIITYALVSAPVEANFFWGQSYIFILFLYSLTLWALLKQHDWLAGVTMGLALVLKTSGLFLLLLLVIQRRWRVLISSLGTAIAVALLSLPWIGLNTWQAYPPAIKAFINHASVSVTAYQTVYSFFNHLLRYDPIWNLKPIIDIPWLIQPLAFITIAMTIAITLMIGRRASATALFAALIPLNTLLVPVAEDHHFVLCLIPIAFLAYELFPQQASSDSLWYKRILFGIALLLLGTPFFQHNFPQINGLNSIFAYPYLFGGCLIWLLTLLILRQKNLYPVQEDKAPFRRGVSTI